MSLSEEDKQWIDARLSVHLGQVNARIERVETSLLTKSPSLTEARLRTRTAVLRAIELEMEAIPYRPQKLEGGTQ